MTKSNTCEFSDFIKSILEELHNVGKDEIAELTITSLETMALMEELLNKTRELVEIIRDELQSNEDLTLNISKISPLVDQRNLVVVELIIKREEEKAKFKQLYDEINSLPPELFYKLNNLYKTFYFDYQRLNTEITQGQELIETALAIFDLVTN